MENQAIAETDPQVAADFGDQGGRQQEIRDERGGPFMTHVIAAIDSALWDITGRAWGVPVYRLLGGPTREKIRAYPTPHAVKVGTGGPHPYFGNPEEIERLCQPARLLRAAGCADSRNVPGRPRHARRGR